MKSSLLTIVILIAFQFSVKAQNSTQNSDTTKVIILSLNDQHAKIDNYGQLKAAVDKIRKENKYVYLFSGGDNFTGNPVVDQYPDKGYPMIDLMNSVGFTASAVGNHEFDYGQQVLDKRIKQANFPFLNANIKDSTGNFKFKPYYIIKLDNGLRIGVISAIQLGTNGIPDSHPTNLKNLTFKNGLEELQKFSYLKDSCNIFMAVTHLGFEDDIKLADLMPDLNIIMGGHTHTLTKPAYVEKDVTIMQAGSNVKFLSEATVFLVNGKVVKIVPEMINIAKYPDVDEQISNKLEVYNDNKELNRVIGVAAHKLSGSDELGSLMTDGVASLDEVDIAFQNNGGIRIDYLNEGNITVKDVYKLDPFGNEVILIKMTSAEIGSLIANSIIKAGFDIDLQVSGLTYTADVSLRKIKVKMRLANGKKLKSNKLYNVGLNSYIASSYTFTHKDPGRSLFITSAQTLINYISTKKVIDYSNVKRAFINKE